MSTPTFLPANSEAPFLNTAEVFPEDPSQLLIKHTSIYTNIANSVNIRQIGQYDLIELLNGQQFFNASNIQQKRFGYRTVYSIGAISSGSTSTTAHNLSGFTVFTNIYGTCITDVVDYRPLPYVSTVALNQQISLTVDDTNITIVSGAGGPNITSAIVVLEYLKN